MALITRISRLFSADVNAVLDRLEDPDVVLKAAVREMAEEIAKGEAQAKRLQIEASQIDTHVSQATQAVQRADAELDSCFAAQAEDLARAVVRRKLLAERQIETLKRRADDIGGRGAELATILAEQRTRLAEMQAQAEVLTATASAADSGFAGFDDVVSPADVDVALLREQQRRAGA